MPDNEDRKFVEQVFSATLALMGILIAVVGILLSMFDDQVQAISKLAVRFRFLIWGTVGCAFMAGCTSFLSMLYLRRKFSKIEGIVWLTSLLIMVVTIGLPVLVWVTLP